MLPRSWRPAFGALAILLPSDLSGAPSPSPASPPVIDMHLHAGTIRTARPIAVCPNTQPIVFPARDPKESDKPAIGARCASPILSAANSAELRDRTIAEMRKHNVRRGVLAGNPTLVGEWRRRAPDLFIPASVTMPSDPVPLAELRRRHAAGQAAVFAELGLQYAGRRGDDPAFEPFWALAETLDVPVGIHLGEGNPGQFDTADDPFRVALTSPFQLESVLQKHPRLRLYVMHAASPLIDEMIAMLFEYQQLYVDVGANVWNMPRPQFYDQLRRLVDAGFGERILFGSDQTIFPQAIGIAIGTINQAPFLSEAQKRDILYNNAARFLRLTPAQIGADHAPMPAR